ncbi:MAG: S-layer protein, partial [Candidatus Aenigmatarchaeota archaeon]
TVYLEPGQSIAFPNNYLKLQYLGLTLTEKDYLATVNFRVVEIDRTKVDLENANSTAVEISGVPLYTGTKAYSKLYAVFNNSQAVLAELNSTGYYVPVSGNVVAGPTGLSLNASNVSDVGVNITVGDNLYFVVDGASKQISEVNGAQEFDIKLSPIENNNTWIYTAFGHKIFVSSDAKSLTLKWTPVQGFARVVLGEATEKVAGGEVVRVLDVNRLQVPVAKLDTEVDLATADKNLVVVGGPYVNRVAAALLNVPYRNFDAIRALYEDLGAIDRGLIKAFDLGGGKVALLVAGWRAEDTRLAASVLQQYERFADRLVAGDTLIVGGTREAPTIEAKTSE